MSTDYNINIHIDGNGGGGDNNNTTPNLHLPATINTLPRVSVNGGSEVDRDVVATIYDTGNTAQKANNGGSWKIPQIATAMAIVAFIDSAITLEGQFVDGYTGNSSLRINYANFKTSIDTIKNPLGTIKTILTNNMEAYRQNEQVEQQRVLTGNSVINNYGGKAS